MLELPKDPLMGFQLEPTTMRVGPKRLWMGLPKDSLVEVSKASADGVCCCFGCWQLAVVAGVGCCRCYSADQYDQR